MDDIIFTGDTYSGCGEDKKGIAVLILRRQGATSAFIFGSHARGEQVEDSDITPIPGGMALAAVEKILDEIRRLSRKEREILLRALEQERVKDEAAERFEKAAGSWADFDADSFLAEVYACRRKGERAVPEW